MQKKETALQLRKQKEEREAKKRQQEASKLKQQKKSTPQSPKGKGKAKVDKPEVIDANKSPICDIKWEDDDGENGEWLGCKCGQWLHEECIDYELTNSYLICPDCV